MTDRYNILYLEHDKERFWTKNELERNLDSTSVKLISPSKAPDNKIDKVKFLNEIKESLMINNYDLVLTDAFFLPEDFEHPNYGDGENIIFDIEKIVISHSPSTKIIVYTHFRNELIKDIENLNIYDIWNKSSTPLNFLLWRIGRSISKPFDVFLGQLLLETVKKYLASKEIEKWEEKVFNMIENYSPQLSFHQNIDNMSEDLRDILIELKIPSVPFRKMLDNFTIQDHIALISSPNTWGHSIHVFNVFWLGFFILNSAIIDIEENRNKLIDILRLSGEEKSNFKAYANRTWIIASLLHDYGIVGEKLENLITNINEIITDYPWYDKKKSDVHIQISHTNSDLKNILENSFDKLKGIVGPQYVSKINESWQDTIDHGILSALAIQEKFKKEECTSFTNAAAACALHKTLFTVDNRISYTNQPFACLLRFCDEIQTWERETGLETIKRPIWIQKTVLTEIKIRSKTDIHFKIEYIPRKDISYDDSKNTTTRKALKDLIDSKTIPALDCINWDGSGIGLHAEFSFRGEELRQWNNQKK